MLESSLERYLEGRTSQMFQRLRKLVEIESGTYDKTGVDRVGTFVAEELKRLGFKIEIYRQTRVGDQIIGRRSFGGKGRLLILSHLDTVWPLGTLKDWPFAITPDGFATGPGIGDMKGGLIMALEAIEALEICNLCHLESITYVLVPDEELGSPFTRTIVEAEGLKADWALVTEPGRPNGGVVTSRGVVGKFILRGQGVTAHCGINYSEGVSALRELAAKVEPMESLSAADQGVTVNVGIFRGGEARQVIPADAEMHIDFRSPDQSGADRLMARLREIALAVTNAKVQLSLEGGQTRPAFPRTAGVLDLYRRAAAIAEAMKIPLQEVHTQGGSDGSLVAAKGIPTLDGIGPIAFDVCSRRERIIVKSLFERTLLMANLIAQLQRTNGGN
jgi:glutamate carboxypeptidase